MRLLEALTHQDRDHLGAPTFLSGLSNLNSELIDGLAADPFR